jgi:hypothetical protein
MPVFGAPWTGWMVQGTGGQVVILNEHGLRALNFGDAPFGWVSTSPDACSADAPTVEPTQ